jgi:hypothetical protein
LGNLSLPAQVKIRHHESKEEKEIEKMKRILEIQRQSIEKAEVKAIMK